MKNNVFSILTLWFPAVLAAPIDPMTMTAIAMAASQQAQAEITAIPQLLAKQAENELIRTKNDRMKAANAVAESVNEGQQIYQQGLQNSQIDLRREEVRTDQINTSNKVADEANTSLLLMANNVQQ